MISYKEAGLPKNLAYRNWKEYGPRLGFAYRAFDGRKGFVIRGGYRMSYYPMRLQEWILGQSDSVPVGAAFQNYGQQYSAFSGRPAKLRPPLGSTIHCRRQHAGFDHGH